MNKKTKVLFLEMFVGVLLFGLLIYFVDSYNEGAKEGTFTGYVVEVLDGAVILKPFPDEKINKTDQLIFASITGVGVGDVILVTHGPEIRETHPASIDVIRYSVIIEAPIPKSLTSPDCQFNEPEVE